MTEDKKKEMLLEINRCISLFNSQIFTINPSDFTESAFIELLIRLNYVLQFLNTQKRRVVWSDDINTDNKIKDITDLVNNLRNAACHQASKLNFVEGTNIKFVFNRFEGKMPKVVKIGEGVFLGCEYEDDIAFYYGGKRIYLIRHIKKLLEELFNDLSSTRLNSKKKI